MLNKTFSVRSNAVRNARIALGKAAQQGVHFTVGGEKGAYTWSPVEGAPPVGSAPLMGDIGPAIQESLAASKEADAKPVKKAKRKVAKASAKTPTKVSKTAGRGRKAGRKSLESVVDVSGKRKQMFKMISSPKGASLEVLTRALGWQKHTVRGAVSTIGSQFKVNIKSYRDARRGRVYQVA